MKRALIILLVAGVGFAAIALVVSHRRAARQAAVQAALRKAKAERTAELERAGNQVPRVATPAVAPAPPEQDVSSADKTPQAPQVKSSPPVNRRAPAVAPGANANPAPRGKPELQDPLARVALSFVGTDPEAEQYWVEAINNPDLPPHERSDLIEDLNEEGFPDPNNLTLDDLPLILSRILLIEWYAPDAMDEVNADAFDEAYKDLVNMVIKLTSGN